jgi:hypothetical protein
MRMPMKREEKVAKRKNKLAKQQKRQQLKRGRTAPVGQLEPKNPYLCAQAVEDDIELVRQAWTIHYGELTVNFRPPFICEDEEGLKMAAWAGTFRDLLLKKYGTMELVEPRFRFVVFHLAQSLLH